METDLHRVIYSEQVTFPKTRFPLMLLTAPFHRSRTLPDYHFYVLPPLYLNIKFVFLMCSVSNVAYIFSLPTYLLTLFCRNPAINSTCFQFSLTNTWSRLRKSM